MPKLLVRVPEATVRPRGYGLVYWDCGTRSWLAVCAPIPLNVLLATLRNAYIRLVVWRHPDKLVEARQAAYMEGFRAGLDTGRRDPGESHD
ncbi:MAG: hypothetical protein M0R06_07340 [Sphaerochaeta sp.]|jgi:hypothetical protein|nr:hypothetical protein [Sphaerochaeta sp.]